MVSDLEALCALCGCEIENPQSRCNEQVVKEVRFKGEGVEARLMKKVACLPTCVLCHVRYSHSILGHRYYQVSGTDAAHCRTTYPVRTQCTAVPAYGGTRCAVLTQRTVVQEAGTEAAYGGTRHGEMPRT
eukprot:3878963-Rhodomonas_salina.4